jgi:hypothetical protein
MSLSSQRATDACRLAEFVLLLTSAERVGGRTRCIGPDRVELYDCARWPYHYTECVLLDFPEVSIDVCSSRQSLTGFAVIFSWRRRPRVEIMWYIAIALGLTSCVYALFTSPWWGAYQWIQRI